MRFTYEATYLFWYILEMFSTVLANEGRRYIAIGVAQRQQVDIWRELPVVRLAQQIEQCISVGRSTRRY